MKRLHPQSKDPTLALSYKLRHRLKYRFGVRLLSRAKERFRNVLHAGLYIRLGYRLYTQPLTSKES